MQNVLAPYLWIFTLVYIDDIVIFSKTFKEHLEHLDKVLKAISKSGTTLSPSKCHFGYQSLLLLGQKASQLGLSTHKEKIEAIIQLAEPWNVKELQTFLGMIVYFSAYILFYAWIVKPLFHLLKKNTTWEWGLAQHNAFELSKQALTMAPIRAYGIKNLGYQLYTDACNLGIAGSLQQVQPIRIQDLKGTKVYDQLQRAYDEKNPVPLLIIAISKDEEEPKYDQKWEKTFEETIVYIGKGYYILVKNS